MAGVIDTNLLLNTDFLQFTGIEVIDPLRD